MMQFSGLHRMPIENIFDSDVQLQLAMALSREPVHIQQKIRTYRCIMPQMCDLVQLVLVGHRSSEVWFVRLDIRTTVQVEIAHPLEQELEMALKGLQHGVHDCPLTHEVR